MALIPHTYFPRSMFDMDQWFKSPMSGTSTLDIFDPFDELDHMVSRNLQWLNKPEFMQPLSLLPRVPQKYRITVDCPGFRPESINHVFRNNLLYVYAREEDGQPGQENYTIREFNRQYQLPVNAEPDKLVSFITGDGRLVIEVPLKETQSSLNVDLFPRIVDNPDGTKFVTMNVSMPSNIDPSKVNVSVKDRDLIVRMEDNVDQPDRHSKFQYYKRTTLPENTNFENLQCVLDNNQILISAPLRTDFTQSAKGLPIQPKPQIKHA